jgi:hypothetical protein
LLYFAFGVARSNNFDIHRAVRLVLGNVLPRQLRRALRQACDQLSGSLAGFIDEGELSSHRVRRKGVSPPSSCQASHQFRGSDFGSVRPIVGAPIPDLLLVGASLTLIAVQLVGSVWIRKLSPEW